jgi:hypothetical protein
MDEEICPKSGKPPFERWLSLLNGQSLASLKNTLGSLFCSGTLLVPAGAASRGLLLSAAGSYFALALLARACASLAAYG